ncbi:type II toxin-antitoxin system ParD family antitoxin [Polymorphobacter sp. PAMC 29334]|uniref:ribbon-helix-helix domain-containing protein n=1 Tax=Polymorphobacter sp. PAMC 29334 TaxID=2862331 RepID=UPI001C773371|nr:type II toxin-antitoxin system ParD family antitoxin [Polymorphobacter sp. PAMC 29334]QYE34399.1 type II toxin-antitoxin system ParD family antitoxin [Polymorphobacter sp. PAMC 29334]
MPTRTITLAEPAAQWVDDRVRDDGYPNADAYVAALVERERAEAEKLTALRAAVAQGLASGISKRSLKDIIRDGRIRHANN